MRPQFTTKQLLSAQKLLLEQEEFVKKGYGSVKNTTVVQHKMLPNTIIIRYEKVYIMGGEYEYEHPIATIDQTGRIEFIDNKFKDVFERSAFLAECYPLEIEDTSKFLIID